MHFKADGIVLKAVDFRDHQKVLTLFTAEQGVISVFAKRLSAKNLQLLTLTSPLTRATYELRKGTSELYTLVDGSLQEGHFELRNTYANLTAGLEMLKVILKTQLPGKSSPMLYHLLALYLDRLRGSSAPRALLASFYLKLLKHEGTFHHQMVNKRLVPCAELKSFEAIEAIDISKKELEKIQLLV